MQELKRLFSGPTIKRGLFFLTMVSENHDASATAKISPRSPSGYYAINEGEETTESQNCRIVGSRQLIAPQSRIRTLPCGILSISAEIASPSTSISAIDSKKSRILRVSSAPSWHCFTCGCVEATLVKQAFLSLSVSARTTMIFRYDFSLLCRQLLLY